MRPVTHSLSLRATMPSMSSINVGKGVAIHSPPTPWKTMHSIEPLAIALSTWASISRLVLSDDHRTTAAERQDGG